MIGDTVFFARTLSFSRQKKRRQGTQFVFQSNECYQYERLFSFGGDGDGHGDGVRQPLVLARVRFITLEITLMN